MSDVSSARWCRTLGERRAILNEQELLQSITDAWDVEVVNTTFHMPLRDAISLMADTDILIGMHGAGGFCCSFMDPRARLGHRAQRLVLLHPQ